MDIATIQGETRTLGGRHANDRLRRQGLVPAVIYGHGKDPEYVSLSRHDIELALAHLQHVVQLKVGGREQQYLIKDVQYDHLQKTPIHVDLMRVDPNERVRVKVAIDLRGTPAGTLKGGTLVQVLAEAEIECLLLKIPDSIRARVDHLELNDMLHVREIEVPPDVKILHSPDDIVAVVHPPRTTVTPEAEAAAPAEGAEPEVISKGVKEEAEDEAGA
ncbi:MAG: 50S ribosomal protein L25 [Planctomycetota bacterium]